MYRWPLWPIIDPIFVTSANMYFLQSQPSHFLLIYLLYIDEEHFAFHPHLQNKPSGMFGNRKYEELSYPKNQEMCSPKLNKAVPCRH